MNANTIFVITAVFVSGCASYGVAPGQMSAKEHEAAAQADTAEAKRHAANYDQKAIRYTDQYPQPLPGCDPSLPASCSPAWSMTKNPTEHERNDALAHAVRAKKHRAAARTLRDAEERACKGVSSDDRDISPFYRVRDIQGIEEIGLSGGKAQPGTPAGVAVLFRSVPWLSTQVLRQIVDCHVARYAALGYDQVEAGDCPLNVRGVKAFVRAIPQGVSIEVTSTDASVALEVVKRARALLPQAPLTSQR